MRSLFHDFTVEDAEKYLRLADEYFDIVERPLRLRRIQAATHVEPGDDQRIQFWLQAAGTAAQMSQAISALVAARQETKPEQEIASEPFPGVEIRDVERAAGEAAVTAVPPIKAIFDEFFPPDKGGNEE